MRRRNERERLARRAEYQQGLHIAPSSAAKPEPCGRTDSIDPKIACRYPKGHIGLCSFDMDEFDGEGVWVRNETPVDLVADMQAVRDYAREHHDGHYSLFSFTTNFRGCYDTPEEMWDERFLVLPEHASLADLVHAMATTPKLYELKEWLTVRRVGEERLGDGSPCRVAYGDDPDYCVILDGLDENDVSVGDMVLYERDDNCGWAYDVYEGEEQPCRPSKEQLEAAAQHKQRMAGRTPPVVAATKRLRMTVEFDASVEEFTQAACENDYQGLDAEGWEKESQTHQKLLYDALLSRPDLLAEMLRQAALSEMECGNVDALFGASIAREDRTILEAIKLLPETEREHWNRAVEDEALSENLEHVVNRFRAKIVSTDIAEVAEVPGTCGNLSVPAASCGHWYAARKTFPHLAIACHYGHAEELALPGGGSFILYRKEGGISVLARPAEFAAELRAVADWVEVPTPQRDSGAPVSGETITEEGTTGKYRVN